MNKFKILIIITLIASCEMSWSQEFVFLGEGAKDEVRFFWIPKKGWPQGGIGINIKRKSLDGKWIKLNSDLIIPGNTQSKVLNNIGLSGSDMDQLVNKRGQLIKSKQLNEIESGTFVNLITDGNTLKVVSLMLNSDFDIALMAGFGFVDMNIPNFSGVYEYGLFLVSEQGEVDRPIAIFNWEYGTSPTIDVLIQGAAKTNKGSKTVDLTWEVDVEKYKNYGVLNGFNIFRKEMEGDFIKLNDKPIWVSLKEAKSTLYYRDINVDLEKGYVYAAAPNTIFNTDGSYSEVKIDPVGEIPEIPSPVLENPQYVDKELQLHWKFEVSDESFIKGFFIQKKHNENNIFENVSELLPANIRAYNIVNFPFQNDNYYHYKVVAVNMNEIGRAHV